MKCLFTKYNLDIKRYVCLTSSYTNHLTFIIFEEYKEHKAVEPIPDRDWVGETWGLYWPDLEVNYLSISVYIYLVVLAIPD